MVQIKNSINLTQQGLYEYALVAHPEASVMKKIMVEKEVFANNYKSNAATKNKPYITIASFVARDSMEETIVRYTQRILAQFPGFEVELNNYSGFPTDTIFLRVQNPQHFKQLANELQIISNYVRSCSCPPIKTTATPRIDIASGLPETVYLKAIMDYSQKTFHETFEVNELLLLRRGSEYETQKKIHMFRLLPASVKLFGKPLFN